MPLHQFWRLKRHKGRAVTVTQKKTYWVWATTERPGHFSGRLNVARSSQPFIGYHVHIWQVTSRTRGIIAKSKIPWSEKLTNWALLTSTDLRPCFFISIKSERCSVVTGIYLQYSSPFHFPNSTLIYNQTVWDFVSQYKVIWPTKRKEKNEKIMPGLNWVLCILIGQGREVLGRSS